MKQTTRYCDFNNPNVKQHMADFIINVKHDGRGEVPSDETDTCANHLHQVTLDMFRKGATLVSILRVEGGALETGRLPYKRPPSGA